MADTPNNYSDGYWSNLASNAETKAGIPAGLLSSIVNYGERSNNDQVSEKGARSPFQIIPSTRKAILDKYGIDPYLNPENAAEGAALLLKESLDRNNGDVTAAVGEYHGGTDRKNWGRKTNSYVSRVVNGLEETQVKSISDDFSNWLKDNPAVPAESTPSAASTPSAQDQPANAIEPDISAASQDFGNWLAQQKDKPKPQENLGFLGNIKEQFTGERRSTPTTQSLPDWTDLPEVNVFKNPEVLSAIKNDVGSIFSSPDEAIQVLKANSPNIQVRQDEKGNYIIKSAIDNNEYAIKPGWHKGDTASAIAGLAAFAPASLVSGGIIPTAAAAAGTQAAIEGVKSAVGGNFNPANVAITGAVGGLAPAAINAVKAGAGLLTDKVGSVLAKVAGKEVTPAAESVAQKAGIAVPESVPVPQPVPAVEPMDLSQTAKTGMRAGEGNQRDLEALAQQVRPDERIVASAKRLGVEDDLQPDHITTNQIYRQLSQAAKSIPGSKAKSLQDEGLLRVAKRADDLIDELGGTRDLSLVDQRVKDNLNTTWQSLKDEGDKLYKQVNEGIPANTPVKADNVVNFVKQNAQELNGSQNLSKLEKNVFKKLSDNPTYALLDNVRKTIGDSINGRGPFPDANIGTAKKLYSLISDDQQLAANAHGLGDVFTQAKGAVQLRKSVEDDLVALFGKNTDGSLLASLGSAVDALPKGDASKFIKLVQSIPDSMRKDVVASGLNTAFGKNVNNGKLNFNSYSKWYEGLRKNSQAYNALMSNLPPQARRGLNDLYRVSSGINKASKEFIGTGKVVEASKLFDASNGLIQRLWDATKHQSVAVAAGAAGSVIHPGVGIALASALSKGAKTPAIQAFDQVLASPLYLETVKSFANGNRVQTQQAVRKLARSGVFNNFVKQVKNPELTDRERWILQSLEAQSSNQNQSKTQATPINFR